jgi:energy-coupling factor transport system ATP-binding protein
MQGTPKEIYSEADELERIGLGIPQIASIVRELRNRGFNIKQGILTIEEAKEEILKEVKRRNV